jgi:hypothetical protein
MPAEDLLRDHLSFPDHQVAWGQLTVESTPSLQPVRGDCPAHLASEVIRGEPARQNAGDTAADGADKPQGVPALAAVLRRHVAGRKLAKYLRSQPECDVYRGRYGLEQFLLEGEETRGRILGDLFDVHALGQIFRELGVSAWPEQRKQERIESILAAFGLPSPVRPEGIEAFLCELTKAGRDAETERDPRTLRGICDSIFLLAERVLKDLAHFYGHWLYGPTYLEELKKLKWAPGHARAVSNLTMGSLRQLFIKLAEQATDRPECRQFFACAAPSLPRALERRLQELVSDRNHYFHDTRHSRKLTSRDLRDVTLKTHKVVEEFFQHMRKTGVYPRKLVLDREVKNRLGQVSYFCLGELHGEVEVITAQALEYGHTYMCLSASSPKYIDPVLVPELVE